MTEAEALELARKLALQVYGLSAERSWDEYMSSLVDADLLKADSERIAQTVLSAYKDGWSNGYDEGMTDMMDK